MAERRSEYDEHDAFLCACKNEPYTFDEWDREVARLEVELAEALRARRYARRHGVCLPPRLLLSTRNVRGYREGS